MPSSPLSRCSRNCGAQDRAHDRQQRRRSPLVAVFLLHDRRQRDYVNKYPIATKHVLRAILKGADLCATEPALVARRLVAGGFSRRYEYVRRR